MIGKETVFRAADDAGSQSLMQDKSHAMTGSRTTGAAQEDDGPIHGSTPPHGDIFAHQITNDLHEFDEDAEEQPLTRS